MRSLCIPVSILSLIALSTGFPFSGSSSSKVTFWHNEKRNDCSDGLTISSTGPAGYVQADVLGVYRRASEKVMGWETWNMECRDDRYLYRCPCGKGNDWLFGKSNGNEVGWIKHRNCNGCPESCSQDNWLYWDDTLKKWYPDIQIRVRPHNDSFLAAKCPSDPRASRTLIFYIGCVLVPICGALIFLLLFRQIKQIKGRKITSLYLWLFLCG